jgi:hypothetical protein
MSPKNPGHEEVGLDVGWALHDDRVDDAGQHLLELLDYVLLGSPEESDAELPEQVVGRQGGRKVVLRLETASLGLQGHDLPPERRNAMATRFFGRSLPDSNTVRATSLTDPSDAPDDSARKHPRTSSPASCT